MCVALRGDVPMMSFRSPASPWRTSHYRSEAAAGIRRDECSEFSEPGFLRGRMASRVDTGDHGCLGKAGATLRVAVSAHVAHRCDKLCGNPHCSTLARPRRSH
jgi:hypothetical protein